MQIDRIYTTKVMREMVFIMSKHNKETDTRNILNCPERKLKQDSQASMALAGRYIALLAKLAKKLALHFYTFKFIECFQLFRGLACNEVKQGAKSNKDA